MHQTGSNDTIAYDVSLARSLAIWPLPAGAAALLARAAVGAAATTVTIDAGVAAVALAVGAVAAAVLALGMSLLVLGASARAAGRRWRAVEAAATRLTPRLLRRALVVGLGAGLSGLAGPALADTPPALGWQVTEQAAAITDATATTVADVHPAEPTHSPRTVVVRPGDCLWSIAAEHLPDGADDADIAQAWPAWYAANADTIGADPDLLLPGQRLVVPDGVDA